jgi:hypothetical protein
MRDFYDQNFKIGGNPMELRSRVKVNEIDFDSLWTMRKALLWLVMGYFLLAIFTPAHGQTTNQRRSGITAKVNNEYSTQTTTAMKRSSNANFSDANLSAQIMIDFFKNENNKLKKEINDLIEKTNASSARPLSAIETDIMRIAILKSKIDYLEVAVKKWATEGNF